MREFALPRGSLTVSGTALPAGYRSRLAVNE
jgi:hypothetical protein